jgi:hypothetical protein
MVSKQSTIRLQGFFSSKLVREDPRVSEFELQGKRQELQNRGVDASEFLQWLTTT